MGGCCGCGGSGKEVFKPRRERWCTDVLCLILFILGMGMLFGLTFIAINKDPSLLDDLRYPPDSYGNNCGKPNSAAKDMPKVIFPRLDKDLEEQMAYLVAQQYWKFSPTKYCAPVCPDGFDLSNPVLYGGADYPGGNTSVAGVYYAYVTTEVIQRCFPMDTTTTYDSTELCAVPSCSDSSLNASLDGSVHCYKVAAQPAATNVWRICAGHESASLCERQRTACELQVDMSSQETFTPAAQTEESDKYTKLYASYVKLYVGMVEGMMVDKGFWSIIIFGLIVPIVMSFVWALFLRFFAGPTIVLLLILMLIFLVAVNILLAAKAGWLDDAADASKQFDVLFNRTDDLLASATQETETLYAFAAVISIVFTALYVLFIVVYRRCITRMIAILKECTKVFSDMFYIVVWPLGGFIFQAVFFFFGLFGLYFHFYVWQKEELWVQAVIMLSHVFGVLWFIQTCRATTWASMSAAIAYWFVTVNAPKPDGKKSRCPKAGIGVLADALLTIMLKHLGSMAFGAAIIAFVQLCQVVMHLIDQLTKDQQKNNKLIKLAIMCAHCCLACLKKTVEFISYYGFVFVAMEGDSFCVACKNTFVFILKYPAQTFVNKIVQKLLSLLIGLSTPVGCAMACFFYLDSQAEYTAEYEPLYASLAVLLIAFIVMDCELIVFNVAIDTIYLCAFKDMDENDPPAFMSNDLRAGFGLDKAKDEASGGSRSASTAYNKVAPEKSGGYAAP